ncbi:Hpt domain-containing protein [Hyphomonas sp.]|uniref:Hpt domain-containing protein n=1 Tax=Hyphomonas sp. TaxID=87 RepID=UPI00391C7E58
MFTKLLAKASELAHRGRKPAAAPVTPDISRVIKPAAQPVASQSHLAPDTDVADFEATVAQAPEFSVEDAPEIETAADTAILAEKAEEAVDAMNDSFDAWMRDDMAKLRAAWAEASADASNAEAFRELYTCAHNIRGAAASYGYPAVSRLCGSLCTLLGNTRPGEDSALINMHVEACRAAVAAGPQGEGSQSVADQLCDALETRVAVKVAATG